MKAFYNQSKIIMYLSENEQKKIEILINNNTYKWNCKEKRIYDNLLIKLIKEIT
tara:strand:+ start:919 stop:1080 length:162 start_codon:yes stop_codon:yes gene_type:complete